MGSANQKMGATCGHVLKLSLLTPQWSPRQWRGGQPAKAQEDSLSRICTQEFFMSQKKLKQI